MGNANHRDDHRLAYTASGKHDPLAKFIPEFADVRVFELPDVHQVMSNGITLHGDRLYLGAAKIGLSSSYGSVFCLDRNTGKVHWKFDNDEDMNPVFCTPTVFEAY